MEKKQTIQLFQQRRVRTAWDSEQEKWYFPVVDVVAILTGSKNPTDYLKKLRKREIKMDTYAGTNCPLVLRAALDCIEELLKVCSNETPATDKNMLELDLISDLVADYEEEHYPVEAPTMVELIKLRMYEMGLTKKALAEMLGLSIASINKIITGKGEPSLQTGREISRKLNIDPAIVLGV